MERNDGLLRNVQKAMEEEKLMLRKCKQTVPSSQPRRNNFFAIKYSLSRFNSFRQMTCLFRARGSRKYRTKICCQILLSATCTKAMFNIEANIRWNLANFGLEQGLEYFSRLCDRDPPLATTAFMAIGTSSAPLQCQSAVIVKMSQFECL